MPEEDTKTNAPAMPDLHAGNAAPFICRALKVPGCVLLVSHESGMIQTIAHGVTHARANEMLSRAIQINLNQLDCFVEDQQAEQALARLGQVEGSEVAQ